MKLHKIFLALAATSLLLTQSAMAEFYVSGNVSKSSADGSESEDLEDAKGYALNLGYQFGRHLSIQAGYVNFGEFDSNEDLNALVPESVDIQVDGASIELEAYEVSLLAGLPVSRYITLYGEVGAYQWENTPKFSVSGADAANIDADRETDEDLFYGVGMEYRLSPKLSLIGETTYYKVLEDKVRQLNAGIKLRF